ncbi:MAG TPA: 50S ribosomal protein L32 [Anaerolineae bacterium]|nr:50S ribosomal protein L32 [Anaerolineae bacterium]HQK15111.1 50S ribosomal protein L32 [Anaerolineae bacterium]
MPAVPKRRTPHGRGKRRSANNYRSPALPVLVYCQCGELVRPYEVCPHCGAYRGKKVMEVKKE